MEKDPIRILIAPLDWGLGHATRCIPIIHLLHQLGCHVSIAAEGKSKHLLQHEFPTLTFLPLKGYRIQYANNNVALLFKVITQIPYIFLTIRYEKKWLKKKIKSHQFHAVISDNRFGFHHSAIPSVYITHQLLIKSPGGAFVQNMLRRIHYRYIRHFTTCWVPDYPTTPNLSGELGHPTHLPAIPLHYLGALSRMEKTTVPERYTLLILLSGPEPQRSLLEEKLCTQLATFHEPVLFIRGLPGSTYNRPGFNQVSFYNHLPANLLAEALCAARWVISRTGYTTVMDLVKLRKNAILIPTPGQPEQEYLATYLRQQHICFTTPQHTFNLQQALSEAGTFHYQPLEAYDMNHYQSTIIAFVESLHSRSPHSLTTQQTS